jgi:tight adherence protein B
MIDLLPSHPLLLPVAVFGFLACLWLFILTLASFMQDRESDSEEGDRIVRAWIGGKETEIRLPASQGGSDQGRILRFIKSAGLRVSPRAFATQSVLALGVTFVLALVVTSSFMIGLAIVALIIGAITFLLNVRAKRRRELIERQCVTALHLASRSLRAGHPVSGMMQVLAERVPAPAGDYFVEIVQREQMGESLDSSIRSILLKAETSELRSFGTALLVQLDAGGNLAETIDRLCSSITDRITLVKRNRALAAHIRFTARVMVALPFIVVVFFANLSSEYAGLLFGDPLGRLFLVGAVLLMLAGLVAVGRILRVDDRSVEVPM